MRWNHEPLAAAFGFVAGVLVAFVIGIQTDQAGKVSRALGEAAVDRAYVTSAAEHFAETRAMSSEALHTLEAVRSELEAIRAELAATATTASDGSGR